MLVNLVEILKMAEEKKCAIGAFNTPNLECVNAVLAAAEGLKVPVILMHAQIHEEFSPLIIYLRQVYKKVRKKNIYCMIYLYQQYIFIVSVDSVIITVITVEEPYEKSYQRVKEFINKNQ